MSTPAICEVNIYDLLAPTDLTATVEDNDVSLSWSITEELINELVEFIICRNEEVISTQTETTYLDEDLPNGEYTYSVVAVYNNGMSVPAICKVIIYDLLAPTDLIAIVEDNNISLSWNVTEELIDELVEFIICRNEEEISTQTETTYLDEDLLNGEYTYSVVAVYKNGVSEPTYTSVITITISEGDIVVAYRTELKGNYPNPFNPTTTIKCGMWSADLQSAECVIIEIFNIKGQKVKTLFDGYLEAGEHSFVWNGTDDSGRSVSSGVYFYKLSTSSVVDIKKMMLLK